MRTLLVDSAILVGLLANVLGAADGQRESPPARLELEAIARELFARIDHADWTAWERHASDALLYTTEFGRTLTKAELRALFRPVLARERRTLKMNVVGFASRGDAAVLVFELCATDSEEPERYRATATFWRVGPQWRLVASQVGLLACCQLECDAIWKATGVTDDARDTARDARTSARRRRSSTGPVSERELAPPRSECSGSWRWGSRASASTA